MISSLRGIVSKGEIPFLTIDVNGVGYEVQCTTDVYEKAIEGKESVLHIHTFVREDRLELFGFSTLAERHLFESLLSVPGIGPRLALLVSGMPTEILCHAVEQQDSRPLSSLKGVGKKMAEKILVELQSLSEKGLLVSSGVSSGEATAGTIDEDALEALANLGYDRRSMVSRLREAPKDAKSTEERVKWVLQTL